MKMTKMQMEYIEEQFDQVAARKVAAAVTFAPCDETGKVA